MNKIKCCDFLAIEELGKEFESKNSLNLTVLDSVARARVQNNLPTLYTSNLDSEQVKEFYSYDLVSMLKESCIIVQVTGEDFRDTIHLKIKKKYEQT